MPDDSQLSIVNRQALTATTLVEIVDTLVSDFDVIDVLTVLTARCVDLLEASAAGILLADRNGRLRVIGASTEQIQLLELFQIQNDQGPCLDCFNTGRVVRNDHLHTGSPWPQFAAESVRAGFPSVCAVPLRLNDVILGCLNLFMSEPVSLSDEDVALAQALADVASITIMQDQVTRDAAIRESQLQHALTSRIAIEQAKGMIAEHDGVDMDDAFARLRLFARSQNRRLTEVAQAMVAGRVPIGSLASVARPTLPPRPGTPAALSPPIPPQPTVDSDVRVLGVSISEESGSSVIHSDVRVLGVSISEESGSSVIHLSGELDMATRQRCFDACLAGDHVVVDMAALTFMDCAGYGGLVAARRVLRERGGTLTLRHPTAQPARLLSILSTLDPLAEPDANPITVEEPKERTTTRDP